MVVFRSVENHLAFARAANTGISGFIAKHVALRLLQAGQPVRGTLRHMARADEVRRALAPHLPPDAPVTSAFFPVKSNMANLLFLPRRPQVLRRLKYSRGGRGATRPRRLTPPPPFAG